MKRDEVLGVVVVTPSEWVLVQSFGAKNYLLGLLAGGRIWKSQGLSGGKRPF